MKRFILCPLLLLVACGGEEPSSSVETSDATTTSSIVDAESAFDGARIDAGVEEQEGCSPGDSVCVDESTLAICGDDRRMNDERPCEEGTSCLEGQCRGPLCTADALRCASWTVRRRCESSGLRWGPPEPCGTDEICHEGQCLTCVPEAPTCATLVATATCDDAGRFFPLDEIQSCPGDEGCYEPTGICLDPECTPNETTCAGIMGTHDCLPSGTRFSPEITPCESAEVCQQGACAPAFCVPAPILFVVDRTAAVGGDWSAFEAAITAAKDAHPSASFGFMPFPMTAGCPGSDAGALPRFPIDTSSDIDLWFSTVSASAGSAALQATLQTVLDRSHEIFGGKGGQIVLISSGLDECNGVPETIGSIVAALRFDQGVSTHVIGHRASAGPCPALDAAHAQGGSSWPAWKETSYDLDLTNAILSALEATPSCL